MFWWAAKAITICSKSIFAIKFDPHRGPSGRLIVPYGYFSILFIPSIYIKKGDSVVDPKQKTKNSVYPRNTFLRLKTCVWSIYQVSGTFSSLLIWFSNNIEIWIFSVSRRELRLGHCWPPFIAAGFLIICFSITGVVTAEQELEFTATGATWHSLNLPSTYKWRKTYTFWNLGLKDTYLSRSS